MKHFFALLSAFLVPTWELTSQSYVTEWSWLYYSTHRFEQISPDMKVRLNLSVDQDKGDEEIEDMYASYLKPLGSWFSLKPPRPDNNTLLIPTPGEYYKWRRKTENRTQIWRDTTREVTGSQIRSRYEETIAAWTTTNVAP